MKSALITGANKGIGFQTAKLLAQQGYYIYLGSRNLESGLAAVEKLKADGITGVQVIQLDVTDVESVKAARVLIGQKIQTLDLLINNAAISGGFAQSALTSTADEFKSVYNTNVFGVVTVTQAFIDLLKNSPEPRIVNVSSAMASLTLAADLDSNHYARAVIYQSSKTALNMYTVTLAAELRNTPFKINAVCPGYTKTDFTGHQGTSTVDQAAQRIAKYATLDQDGPTGKYFSEEYFPESTCPW